MPRTEEVRVRAGEATLVGTLTLPHRADRAGARLPAVLLLPSWLPRDRDGGWDRVAHASWFSPPAAGMRTGLLARLAETLAARGVASLRCDPRGCGASEGTWQDVSLFTRIDDARDMVAAMRSHGGLDLRRMGIIGHGEGAAVAISVAIGDPAISALTLIGPTARSWRDVLRCGVAERSRNGADQAHPIVAALDRCSEELIERAERREAALRLRLTRTESVVLQLAGTEQAIHTPPRALATMLHRSVALVHGSLDAWAHPDESELLALALEDAGNQTSRRMVDTAGHDLAEAPDGVFEEIAADLAGRIQPVELPPVLLAIEEMSDGLQ